MLPHETVGSFWKKHVCDVAIVSMSSNELDLKYGISEDHQRGQLEMIVDEKVFEMQNLGRGTECRQNFASEEFDIFQKRRGVSAAKLHSEMPHEFDDVQSKAVLALSSSKQDIISRVIASRRISMGEWLVEQERARSLTDIEFNKAKSKFWAGIDKLLTRYIKRVSTIQVRLHFACCCRVIITAFTSLWYLADGMLHAYGQVSTKVPASRPSSLIRKTRTLRHTPGARLGLSICFESCPEVIGKYLSYSAMCQFLSCMFLLLPKFVFMCGLNAVGTIMKVRGANTKWAVDNGVCPGDVVLEVDGQNLRECFKTPFERQEALQQSRQIVILKGVHNLAAGENEAKRRSSYIAGSRTDARGQRASSFAGWLLPS